MSHVLKEPLCGALPAACVPHNYKVRAQLCGPPKTLSLVRTFLSKELTVAQTEPHHQDSSAEV